MGVCQGNEDLVICFLQHKPPLDVTDQVPACDWSEAASSTLNVHIMQRQKSALELAMDKGSMEMVQLLVESNAPLDMASTTGDPPICRVLKEAAQPSVPCAALGNAAAVGAGES